MARVEERVAEESRVRLPDLVGVGVLTAAFPPEVVDLVVERWDAREQRSRLLPARLVVYYVIACVLFMDSAYVEVWNRLLSGLSWAGRYRTRREVGMQPTAAALTKARGRLGPEVLEGVLETSFGGSVVGPEQAPWGYFHGLRKVAVDGFCLNVARTPENVAAFGSPSNGQGPVGYPQVRVVALAETGTRCLRGVALGGLGEGEQPLARTLWPLLGSTDVVVGDRNFLSYEDLGAIAATGAHAVFRVKAGVDLPVLRRLADGSWISRIADPVAARRLRRRKVPPAEIPGIEVRVIEYTVETEPDQHGEYEVSELFCLVTTLLDERAYPLGDFPDLYRDRWRIETAIGEVETRLRGGADVVLRSRKPDLVRQEVYGLLCLYQAIRHLIVAGAEQAGLDPDRISFTRARDAVARHVSDDAAFSPRTTG
ncbi:MULTISPECIES: IS4 family transposase [unclassified Solwaraspora]|uniref:IS4 family transposase n=1 Tax=unclassified Solwaraspora TaxID=2627926 RepID=UPI00248CF47C|nr:MULTISPECIES: IS4 family transposase [unclassified Solwaraspora]WBB97754.1 IS4 family transposase [Solwaraspora sp. WMMA2059]WBB98033.1 IS4 family transposase [Solwaraspora sp. WMMA2059]WBC18356.1 IS4 family transposase [Solwaraspora sp. WMMA2080]WBC23411.1 IS4 family transposase [Solwaraspora sp. WMMA2080]WJK32471.1 IS4 family transposase [Solwaraspora sp. WMMA2065]